MPASRRVAPANLGSFDWHRGIHEPLYACDHCGFTSAAFRPQAAASHRLEYPECVGVIRIVFRSDERYRGWAYEPSAVIPPVAGKSEDGRALSAAPGRVFAMQERLDGDETVRLTLLGDLDLAVADRLAARLAELKAAGRPVRLDLSQLAFIDSTGVQTLLVALTDARWTGWHLEVAPELTPNVERAAQVVGIAQVPMATGSSSGSAGPSTSRAALGARLGRVERLEPRAEKPCECSIQRQARARN